MFRYRVRHGLSVLLLLTIFSLDVFAADAVSLSLDFDEIRQKNGEVSTDQNRVVRSDVTSVTYDQTEAGLVPATVTNAMQKTLAANPGAKINFVCAAANGTECKGLFDKVGADDKLRGKYDSETLAGPPGGVATPPTNVAVNPNGSGNLPPPSHTGPAGAPGSNGEPQKKFSDWGWQLSLIRTVSAWGAVTLTVAATHGWDFQLGMYAGIASAVWSGGMQMIQRPYGNWLRQDSWLKWTPPHKARQAFDNIDAHATDPTTNYLRLLKKHTVDKRTFSASDLESFSGHDRAVNPFDVAPDRATRFPIATDAASRSEFAEVMASGDIDWKRVQKEMKAALEMHADATKVKQKTVEGKGHFNWVNEEAAFLKSMAKKGISSSLYSLALSGWFYHAGVNAHAPWEGDQAGKNAAMVGESLYNQTAWETLISESQERAIREAKGKPNEQEQVAKAKRKAGVKKVVLSFINVATNALNVAGVTLAMAGDVKAGLLISGTVGTMGIITYGSRWLPESWKNAARATLCRAIGILAAPFRGKSMPGEEGGSSSTVASRPVRPPSLPYSPERLPQ